MPFGSRRGTKVILSVSPDTASVSFAAKPCICTAGRQQTLKRTEALYNRQRLYFTMHFIPMQCAKYSLFLFWHTPEAAAPCVCLIYFLSQLWEPSEPPEEPPKILPKKAIIFLKKRRSISQNESFVPSPSLTAPSTVTTARSVPAGTV